MALDRTWYNALVDDNGTGTTGTVWDKARINDLLNTIDAGGASSLRLYVKLFNAGVTAVPHDVTTVLPMNSEETDLANIYAGASGRITLPANGTGLYLVTGRVHFAFHATGDRQLRIRRNGADEGIVNQRPVGSGGTMITVTYLTWATAGTFFELAAYHDAGVSLNTGDASARIIQNEFALVRLLT